MRGPRFSSVAERTWAISPAVPEERRALLLENVPYEAIADGVLRSLRSIEGCEEPHKSKDLKRIVFSLRCCRRAIDLLHNSRCGLRAQYYRSVRAGDAANDHLLRVLLPRLTDQPERLERLLRSRAGAKVWIHEGAWLQNTATAERLTVKRWLRNGSKSNDLDEKELAGWGTLIPGAEPCLEVKGPWQDPQGNVHVGKPRRSLEIHSFGYT